MMSYGMSPFPQGQPVYALLWEGTFGRLYEIDEELNIRSLVNVLDCPGQKYSFLSHLGSSTHGTEPTGSGLAGKLMALTAFGRSDAASPDSRELIERILEVKRGAELVRSLCSDSRYCGIGVESQGFKDLAAQFSNRIFDTFYQAARAVIQRRQPLLISGGCGLNCDWNSKWHDSGLFSDVFVPPCCNDSGISLRTALDPQFFFTGKAKIDWELTGVGVLCNTSLNFSGLGFINQTSSLGEFHRKHAIDGAIIDDHLYLPRASESNATQR